MLLFGFVAQINLSVASVFRVHVDDLQRRVSRLGDNGEMIASAFRPRIEGHLADGGGEARSVEGYEEFVSLVFVFVFVFGRVGDLGEESGGFVAVVVAVVVVVCFRMVAMGSFGGVFQCGSGDERMVHPSKGTIVRFLVLVLLLVLITGRSKCIKAVDFAGSVFETDCETKTVGGDGHRSDFFVVFLNGNRFVVRIVLGGRKEVYLAVAASKCQNGGALALAGTGVGGKRRQRQQRQRHHVLGRRVGVGVLVVPFDGETRFDDGHLDGLLVVCLLWYDASVESWNILYCVDGAIRSDQLQENEALQWRRLAAILSVALDFMNS
mmetsp:Transcript_14466/g.27838  ORF Transcript_14466/g.27838 Transcript_14466/m.27838 type:complete len:323 (+) Transcript_14466:3298-4266(+)